MVNKVLFVCTGNTCRSAMAKGIYKKRCKEENIKINIKSAGTHVINNYPANSLAISTMKKFGVDISKHISRQITKNDILSSKIILTMEKYHKDILNNYIANLENKVYTLYEYVKNIDRDIEDPFGKSEKEYIKIAEELIELIYNIKIF